MSNSKVPKQNEPYVLRFCKEIVPRGNPKYVPVKPLKNKPVNECFTILPEYVKQKQGHQVFGWTIWELPTLFIEAEFHCVWQTPTGNLVDISPKPINVDRILFLQDPSVRYEGKQVDNHRKPLTSDRRVHRFCELAHEFFCEMNRGDLATKHGMVNVPPRGRLIQAEMKKLYLEFKPRQQRSKN